MDDEETQEIGSIFSHLSRELPLQIQFISYERGMSEFSFGG